MPEYLFRGSTLTDTEIEAIIETADYDASSYTYQRLVGDDGYAVRGDAPMMISRLARVAKELGLAAEIAVGSDPRVTLPFGDPAARRRTRRGTVGHAAHPAPAASYSLRFINETSEPWTFVVYQTLPGLPGLVSLSWKQATVARGGEASVSWDAAHLVGVLSHRRMGGKSVYRASQKLGTPLGAAWDVVLQDGALQLLEAAPAPGARQIVIHNRSEALADVGIGIGGDIALVQPRVESGAMTSFEVRPTYWVAMYKDLVKGEVVSGAPAAGPLAVDLGGSATSLTYRAWTEHGHGRACFAEIHRGAPALRAAIEPALAHTQVGHTRGAVAR
jgi:hypothetical protein